MSIVSDGITPKDQSHSKQSLNNSYKPLKVNKKRKNSKN